MTLGYSKPHTIALAVVGVLLALVGIAIGNVVQVVPGVLLVVLARLLAVYPAAVLEEGELQLKNSFGKTIRRFPVAGPADLRVEGNRVVHVPTGRKTARLGFGIDGAQAAQWREWIATGGA